MTTARKPDTRDFHQVFARRLRDMAPDEEVVWFSNTVPVRALRAAYPLGIFPWPGDDPGLFPWVSPAQRGVLPLERFHLGRSTRRHLRRAGFHVTRDRAFDLVIHACHRAHAPHSWIHPRMRAAYRAAHRAGFAHSVEVWRDGELAGGLYGIDNGHFFSGESMFHHLPHAGKAAIADRVEASRARGDLLLDIQQLTPHMRAMGAEEWSRPRFLSAILPPREI